MVPIQTMTVYKIDPLLDPRWLEFLLCHPRASIFHGPQWLAALKETYGYKPVVYTTTGPGQSLQNGIVFSRVKDWLRGCRMVSLPFSDHCQPLVDSEENLQLLLAAMRQNQAQEKWKYIELRPLAPWQTDEEIESSFVRGEEFLFHALDLKPNLNTMFHSFHKSC